MKYTHEIVGTHGGALSGSVPLEHAPGAKSLVCIGLYPILKSTLSTPNGARLQEAQQ